jgi:formylglycine-generating enzyme required for sulfatase activity
MSESKSCCGPSMPAGSRDPAVSGAAGENIRGQDLSDMVLIPGGAFRMGCDRREGHPSDGEGPSRVLDVAAFLMDATSVSNARFARFIEATGYLTDAERLGWSFVFAGLLPDDFEPTRGVAAAPWWREVYGADWRHPEGPHSDIAGRDNLPVVHVSHNDALAFCRWAGKRLPTETEWEKAARGGLEAKRFPWGDDETPGGQHRCNVWQGTFPSDNIKGDGFYGLAPVDAFRQNEFGLYNIVGNCWQWCANWFDDEHRAMRGGSFLCHPSYCWRYRCAARSASTPDSTTGHVGFRCVRDVE